jgi:Icc-related predicted phosphoesterase
MKIDCIADLHGFLPKLEGGDLLIVAGDLTAHDHNFEYLKFFIWLDQQKYTKKIVIAGNHDQVLVKKGLVTIFKGKDIEYLCDSGTEFQGLKIWGSPWTPWFHGVNPKCKAFMRKDRLLTSKWAKIPMKTDILITHGPAYGILDGTPLEDGSLYHCGSQSLYNWLKYVERPRYHIFGHIHEAYGSEEHFATYNDKMMQSINCSYVNEHYQPTNNPVRIEII